MGNHLAIIAYGPFSRHRYRLLLSDLPSIIIFCSHPQADLSTPTSVNQVSEIGGAAQRP